MTFDIELMTFKKYKVYIKKYMDLNDFLQTICDTKINPIFYNPASTRPGKEFSGTNSFEEAWNLCRFTMNDGFEDFSSLYSKIKYEIDYLEKKIADYSVVGYNPNVPRYLLGLPTNMNSYSYEQNERIINIYMNAGYPYFQTHNQVKHRGILVLNLIDYLEKKGYKVNFYNYDLSKIENEMCLVVVPLKLWNERMNIKKMYFPLVHPSFLRRLLFRAEELLPLQNYEWRKGYGIALEYEEACEFFSKYTEGFDNDKIIYISTPKEMNIKGIDIKEDFENFKEIINKKYNLFEEKIRRK